MFSSYSASNYFFAFVQKRRLQSDQYEKNIGEEYKETVEDNESEEGEEEGKKTIVTSNEISTETEKEADEELKCSFTKYLASRSA